jgi:phage major head subunit gpT-like protein
MTIVPSDISSRLQYGVRQGFLAGMKNYESRRGMFVRETTSTGAFETYSDMGASPWPVQNGGQTGPGADDGHIEVSGGLQLGQGPTILGAEERALRIYNRGWDIPVKISQNALDDDRVEDLMAWARRAGRRFEQHKDYLAFNMLNIAAASTAATATYGFCYDGLPLVSASHVYPRAEYTTAQDNENTLTLTLANYDTVVVAGSNFKDSRGIPLGLSHDLLIVPPALRVAAAQIKKNLEDSSTANRAMNAYAGTGDVIEAPGGWLDATAWFVVDASDPDTRPVIMQTRQEPTLLTAFDPEGPDGGTHLFRWVARYTVAPGEWAMILQGNT